MLLGLLASATAAIAQASGGHSQPLDLTADSVEYDSARSVYVARGDVHIVREGRTLDADWVAYNPKNRQGIALGHVVVHEGQDVLTAESLRFEADAKKGIVYGADFDSGGKGFRASGDVMRKVGEHHYQGEGVTLTTCRCPTQSRDPWALRAGKADVRVGGYATARNNTVEILGVPVAWLPWLRFPVKKKRESGLLLPEVSFTGRNGAEVGLPIFWAARHDLNVTATPRYLADRGLKTDLELEYVLGERGDGDFFGTYLHDRKIDPNSNETPFDRNRWAGVWQHDQDLPWGFRFKADARALSDNQIPLDFNALRLLRNDRFAQSTLFIENDFGPLDRYSFSTAIQLADDLQNPDDQDRDKFLLQRLPDIRLGAPAAPIGWLGDHVFWSFDSRYTFFTAFNTARNKFGNAGVVGRHQFLDTGIDAIPDGFEKNAAGSKVAGDAHLDDASLGGPEGNGVFDEGEPLGDRGSRLVLNPRITIPFQIGDWLEVSTEAGYHGTFYATSYDAFSDRNLATGLVDVRTRLRRKLTLPFGLGDAVHLLEPRLVWTGVTSIGQRSDPLFIPQPAVLQRRLRQLEPTSITRDPSDRISAANAITAAVGSRIYVQDSEGEGALERLWLDSVLSFKNDFQDDRLRNLYLDGTLNPSADTFARFNVGYDFKARELSEALASLGWSSPRGHDLVFSYRRIKEVPRFFEDFNTNVDRFRQFKKAQRAVNQVDFFGRWAVTPSWALSYNLSYSIEQSALLANRGGVEYISRCKCWALRVQVESDRTSGIRFGLNYTIIGLGDDAIRPFSGARQRRQESFIENPNEEPGRPATPKPVATPPASGQGAPGPPG